MARNKEYKKGKGKNRYAILVDGETEKWYLELMKEHEVLPLVIKPELHKKKKLEEQYNNVVSLANDYDKVIWILDFDVLIKEKKESKKGDKPKIQEFKEYVAELNKLDNVEILVNTPCLEFWYLLHFKETGKYYPNYESVVKELKKHEYLKDYKKTQEYYKKKNNDIYKKIKDFQNDAIIRAKRLGKFDFKNAETAKAEICRVFELLTKE